MARASRTLYTVHASDIASKECVATVKLYFAARMANEVHAIKLINRLNTDSDRRSPAFRHSLSVLYSVSVSILSSMSSPPTYE